MEKKVLFVGRQDVEDEKQNADHQRYSTARSPRQGRWSQPIWRATRKLISEHGSTDAPKPIICDSFEKDGVRVVIVHVRSDIAQLSMFVQRRCQHDFGCGRSAGGVWAKS